MTNPLTASQTWLEHDVAGFFSKHPPLPISFVFLHVILSSPGPQVFPDLPLSGLGVHETEEK